jgi:transcriptional regulator with XRE-family HTH domain
MSPDRVEGWHDLGSFIREQRAGARLSLRRLSELAGISNPYLSQIERGLRRPSADILQQIAKALRISAETLYVQAGILDPPSGGADLVEHIRADPHLAESQKQALVQIYRSFRREHEARPGHGEHEARLGHEEHEAHPGHEEHEAHPGHEEHEAHDEGHEQVAGTRSPAGRGRREVRGVSADTPDGARRSAH